jgi:hypothetical protein
MTRAPRFLRLLLPALLGAALLAPLAGTAPASAAVPGKSAWLADVAKAMDGSQRYVDRRASGGQKRLAVNLDIDNTSLASHYDHGAAVRTVLRFARNAQADHVAVLFNTGRVVGDGRIRAARRELVKAGYVVTGICGRSGAGESLSHSKQRCRRSFVDKGWTIIANVGNRSTDFAGSNYERAYRLPNYAKQLA